jgi:hypothetical protein
MIADCPETEVGPLLLDIVLPIELKNRNDGQGYSHWRTVKEKQQIDDVMSLFRRKPFDVPVFLVITRLIGTKQQPFDTDSLLRGNWKQIQDSMVQAGWFYDDNPTCIRGVYGRQDATDRSKGPAIRVQVYQSGSGKLRPVTEDTKRTKSKRRKQTANR